jgi:hypothetical protein
MACNYRWIADIDTMPADASPYRYLRFAAPFIKFRIFLGYINCCSFSISRASVATALDQLSIICSLVFYKPLYMVYYLTNQNAFLGKYFRDVRDASRDRQWYAGGIR